MRHPRAVLPGPYSCWVASLSLLDVEDVRCRRLHPVGGLHRFDRALDFRVVLLESLEMEPIETLHEVHLAPLIVELEFVVMDVWN